MDNSKTKNKSYKRFLTDKNKFDGKLNLSDGLVESSDVLLSIILKQTNLKNQISVENYLDDSLKYASDTFNNSFYKKNEDFDSLFGYELFEKYLSSIKNKFHSQEYKPILSNKKQIEYLLDELTDIFYTRGNSFNGLEHIWIVFIQSLQDCMDKLEKDQKYPFLSPKKHYKDVRERSVPNNWGWFEFHIKSFANSFTNTLIDCLNSETKLTVKHKDLESIYDFSKEILKRKRVANECYKDSKGFSTLGEYINPKIDSLARTVNFYERNRVEDTKFTFNETTIILNEVSVNQDVKYNTYDTTINIKNEFNSIVYENLKYEPETVSFGDEQKKQSNSDTFKNHSLIEDFVLTEDENVGSKVVLPILEKKDNELIPNDFIDIFVGKNRNESESVFFHIMESLPKGIITKSSGSFFWDSYSIEKNLPKNKFGMYIYAFYHTCCKKELINFTKLPTTEKRLIVLITKLVRNTFNIPEDIKISPVMFKDVSPKSLKLEFGKYLTPFEKIPDFSKKLLRRK